MTRLPKKLRRQPLVESLIEVRVGAVTKPLPVVLPGLIFSRLPDLFTGTEALPLSSLPKEIRQQDPKLRFKPYQRLVGDRFTLSFGDNVIALSRLPPYGGWEEFRETMQRVATVIKEGSVIESVTRYSMKSLNIIPQFRDRQLDMLRFNVNWPHGPISDQGFRMRCEFNDERWVRIVEVSPNATSMTSSGERFSGLNLNIDCIREIQDKYSGWSTVVEGLNELHDECKTLFFSILTDDTIQELEPEYGD